MTAANEQIVTAFEVNQMSPEEIAAEMDYEVAAVKSILMQCSMLYRRACKTKDELCFTDEEEVMARQVIANIARYSEDEHLKLRAAVYIRDDKKGRLDAVKASAGLNINVVMMQEQMKKALAAVNASKQAVVDIPAEVKQLDPKQLKS